ncbi:MAG: efflux RND transporter permease subunit [Gammaproteobacteria bacterium]
MIAALVRFSLAQRLLLALLTLALAGFGVWAFRVVPIDAFPDIASPQVLVIAKAPGMAPAEVESRITFPVELEMQGIERQTVLRSTTKYALASIVVDFEDGTDIYWARQQVAERLSQVRDQLPDNIEIGLGPITSPLGEVYMYRVAGGGLSNQELRGIQDWVIRPRLRTVDGVADVNSLGGEVRAFEVMPDPAKLRAYGLGLDEVEAALKANNRNAGGDRINRDNEMLLVRTEGRLTGLDDIRRVTVTTRDGAPVRVADVADVRIGHLTRYGGVTADGQGEVVTGLVLLRRGANSRAVTEGVKREFAELAPTLPKGVKIIPFYDRAELVEAAVATVETALAEAVVLVLIVLVILLGNLRAALTVALILPLSVLASFGLMYAFGVSANLMSLGGLAIAIGMLVDAAVVIVENIHTQLVRDPSANRLEVIERATREVAGPVIAGILIIVIVFLPLFSLTGLEGKMFKPLAVTISLALAASLVLSLTVIPAAASLLMAAHGEEREARVLVWLKRGYRPLTEWVLAHRKTALGAALLLLAGAGALFPFIGREFMPTLDEGTTVIIIEKDPSISLEASLAMDAGIHRAMMKLPEVTGVVSRTGADELRLDPMGLYQTDNFIQTRPRSEWTRGLDEFHEALRKELAAFEGLDIAFTQPIDMRVSEMITGVRAAMAVKLHGADLAVLEQKSKEIEALLGRIPGATDIVRAPLTGQKYVQVTLRSADLARYGMSAERVNRAIEMGVAGAEVAEIVERDRRTPLLLRYPEAARGSIAALRQLLIETPRGDKVPLRALADVDEADGPVQITREAAKRQVVIQADVAGRDMVGFVDDVRAAIARDIELPQGYYVSFGGQFENQQRAAKRLALVVPVAVGLIFMMLFTVFGSLRQALLVILNIPFALIGGVVSLYLSGLYLSVPASVGFITLFGVAVLNGIVMVSYFNQLRARGSALLDAVREGTQRRLRPVLMTALIASLGLLPMLLATGPGSEVQRPLAVVVIGGLVTSTLLTLALLPMLYAWIEGRGKARA